MLAITRKEPGNKEGDGERGVVSGDSLEIRTRTPRGQGDTGRFAVRLMRTGSKPEHSPHSQVATISLLTIL
ncbi:MAG TPA: hypothetical protein VMT57_08365 [Candidatus Thermoplasmatota archaeon]|nr:hypothetical protein [Candidatus Thermoplasmatota archaeon]